SVCDDRGQPSDAAVSWALVNPEPDRHSADFSSLVLPMGRGRHPARCSPPGALQKYSAIEFSHSNGWAHFLGDRRYSYGRSTASRALLECSGALHIIRLLT